MPPPRRPASADKPIRPGAARTGQDGAIALLRHGDPGRPAFDAALSHALLRRVAAGQLSTLVRLYRPGPTLALSRLDRLRTGCEQAAAVARARGYEPVLRLVGGRAAAYDPDSLVYEEIVPAPRLYRGLEDRFARVTGELRDALSELGFDPRIGELPGEYCPGRHSLNLAGRVKVAGVAQRAVRGAALVSAVLVVAGEERIRAVLRDAYAALDYEWDPSSVGSLAGARADVGVQDVERALLSRLQRRGAVTQDDIDGTTQALATSLLHGHALPTPPRA